MEAAPSFMIMNKIKALCLAPAAPDGALELKGKWIHAFTPNPEAGSNCNPLQMENVGLFKRVSPRVG